jgi:hypothetical protein
MTANIKLFESKEQEDEKASTEYSEFRVIQDRNYVIDFEKLIQPIENPKL